MSEFVRFYHPPGSGYSSSEQFIGLTKKVHQYEYNSNWQDRGDFRLVISTDKTLLSTLSFDTLLIYDGDTHIIEDIETAGSKIILSGTDLKGLLRRRRSSFNASVGYDAITGTTRECAEHYIDANFINTDNIRKMPLTLSDQSVTGLNDEAYMARMEDCGDIIKNLCVTAGIGYDITWDGPGFNFVFRLFQGVDRSIAQSATPRVIFSPPWKNVKSMEFSHISSDCYNAIYSEDANKTVRCHYRDNTVPEGLSRRECIVSVNGTTESDAKLYALESVKDNVITHGYKVSPVSSGFGTKYMLGDIVSVRDPDTGNIFSGVISEVQKNYSSGQKNIEITVGEGKKKLFAQIINNIISGTQKRR